jgi:hypothetical protein
MLTVAKIRMFEESHLNLETKNWAERIAEQVKF